MAAITPVIQEDVDAIVAEMRPALSAFAGATVLVTGAAGFVCAYVLDVLHALNARGAGRPCHVMAVDNFKTGLPDRVAHLRDDPNFEFFEHDVSKPLDIGGKAQWILHGASIASPSFYRRWPLETIDVNVSGTRQMLERARRDGALGVLHLSSSEVYGDPPASAVPTPESYVGHVSCTGPRACYDESKRLSETLCMTYHRAHSTPVNVVRPFNVYGPGQRLDDSRIMPDLLRAAVERRPLVLHSDGKATRSFCYVADFIRGALRVWLDPAKGEVYNVGNDEEVSIAELALLLAKLAGSPPLRVEHRPSPDSDYLVDNPQRRCPDLRKIASRTGWRPRVALADGLRRCLASYGGIPA